MRQRPQEDSIRHVKARMVGKTHFYVEVALLMESTHGPNSLVRGVLLALLPLLALVIYLDGQQYDPHLLDFKAGKANQTTPLTKALQADLGTLVPTGVLRSYGKDNLYEYVDGHAEFFLGAGFVALTVAEYSQPGKSNQPTLTVDLFDMGKPMYAFGVLMDEMGAGAEPVAVGGMGFTTNRGLSFIHGAFYLKMAAFQDGLPLTQLATVLANRLPVDPKQERLAFTFPDLGKTVSTRFIKENYRGMDFFTQVLERTFMHDGQQIQAFLRTGSAEEIAKLRQQIVRFLQNDGIVVNEKMADAVPHVDVADPYEGNWFFLTTGNRLLGVFGVTAASVEPSLQKFIHHDQKEKTLQP